MTSLLAVPPAVPATPAADLHAPFDKVLDVYVRDGFVYYRALKSERKTLDQYVQSLDVSAATVAGWPKHTQLAFWINAYNATVLETIIDKYPIKGTAEAFPPNSIQQIPGAFGTKTHRVAGQSLTLDGIEQIVVGFGDARALLALCRGAIGSARLKSTIYRGDSAAALDEQLDQAVKDFVTHTICLKVDRAANALVVSPLFGWRQDAFIASFAKAGERYVSRTPLEQAIAGMAAPFLFQSERDFLQQNTFQLKYGPYDWRLNDLTGGIPN